MPRADRVQAGDVADLRAAGHGHGASVVKGEEGRGVGPRSETDAEQALAPVDGQAEGIGQHVAGGEDPLHPGDAHGLVCGLDAHHITVVRAHERQAAGGGEAEGGGGLGRLRRDRGCGIDRAGQPAAAEHRGRPGDAVAHAVRAVGDDQIDFVRGLTGDTDADPRSAPRLPTLGAADERAPALALRADQPHE